MGAARRLLLHKRAAVDLTSDGDVPVGTIAQHWDLAGERPFAFVRTSGRGGGAKGRRNC